MSETVAPAAERNRGWQVRRLPDPPRWVAPLYAAMAVLLIPWVVYLAFTLPRHTGTPHYRLAWIGFDSLLVLALARTAYLAIRNSPFVVNVSSATATLLLVDAWFDVTTSRGRSERLQALAAALLLEIPIALLTLWIAARSQQRMTRVPAEPLGLGGNPDPAPGADA